jgi:hypothetical protein
LRNCLAKRRVRYRESFSAISPIDRRLPDWRAIIEASQEMRTRNQYSPRFDPAQHMKSWVY